MPDNIDQYTIDLSQKLKISNQIIQLKISVSLKKLVMELPGYQG